jgi:hypothetical protein
MLSGASAIHKDTVGRSTCGNRSDHTTGEDATHDWQPQSTPSSLVWIELTPACPETGDEDAIICDSQVMRTPSPISDDNSAS